MTFLAILSLVPIFHFPIPRSRFPIPDSQFPILVPSGNKTFQVHDSTFQTSWILIGYAFSRNLKSMSKTLPNETTTRSGL